MRQIPQSEVQDFTDKDLQRIFGEVEDGDVVGIDQFKDIFLDHLTADPSLEGIPLPWAKTQTLARLRPAEISVWAGINGHKKSTVLSQCLLWASSKVKVGLASFEMPIHLTAKMMCKQAACTNNPPREYGERFTKWIEDRFYWYRVLGGVEPIQCLGAIHAMAKRGCKIIAIDNLQFTGVTEDIVRERLFFNQLIGLAESLNIHICIVHHVRKPERGGDEYVPTRFDVRGGGTIVDQAHVLFIVWHNKKKAEVIRKQDMGLTLTDKERQIIDEECDLKLVVAKQRNAGFEGTIALYETPGQAFKEYRKSPKLVMECI